jgi:hypothetical protein
LLNKTGALADFYKYKQDKENLEAEEEENNNANQEEDDNVEEEKEAIEPSKIEVIKRRPRSNTKEME